MILQHATHQVSYLHIELYRTQVYGLILIFWGKKERKKKRRKEKKRKKEPGTFTNFGACVPKR
jgi:hypothetical protein